MTTLSFNTDGNSDKKSASLVSCMIVKNEAHCIQRTLNSIKDLDHHVIVDTGSTDDTCKIVEEFTKNDLFRAEFADFSQARNYALELGKQHYKDAWGVVLSADEVLIGVDKLRAFLDSYKGSETAFNVELVADNGHSTSPSPRIVRFNSPARYEGVVHEMLVDRIGKKDITVSIPGVKIEHTTSDPERRLRRMADFDRVAMEMELSKPDLDEFWRRRYTMFLAQTYEMLGEKADVLADTFLGVKDDFSSDTVRNFFTAFGLYRQRMETGGPENEVNYANFHYLRLGQHLGVYTANELSDRLTKLTQIDPKRPEAKLMLAMVTAEAQGTKAGLKAALDAAHTAHQAKNVSRTTPVDPAVEWRSWLLAAQCANAEKETGRTMEYAKNAISAGAPKELFEGVL